MRTGSSDQRILFGDTSPPEPDGSRARTPLRDSSGLPISSKQDVENVILQTIQIYKNIAKGDQQKFYQYMVESLKAMNK